MKIPKNHKDFRMTQYIHFWGSTEDDAVDQIRNVFSDAVDRGCIEPRLYLDTNCSYGDAHYEFFIQGHEPMTEREIAREETKVAKEKAAEKAAKEGRKIAEQKELVRLAKKFKVDLPEKLKV